MQADRQIFR